MMASKHISFDDLSRTMEEFDVVFKRPAFIEEKQVTAAQTVHHQRPNQGYSHMHSDPNKRFHLGDPGKGVPSHISSLMHKSK